MSERPHAFLSYARFNDEHDKKLISWLCDRLAAEVQAQTGLPFVILRDNKDIVWGKHWREFVEDGTASAALMFVIMSPSYFRSEACRWEYESFKTRESELKRKDLILPIYYLEVDEFEEDSTNISDVWLADLKARNYERWSHLRFHGQDSTELRQAIGRLANQVKLVLKSLELSQVLPTKGIGPSSLPTAPQRPAPPDWQATVDSYRDLTRTQQAIMLCLYQKVISDMTLDDFYVKLRAEIPSRIASIGELLYRIKDLAHAGLIQLRSNGKKSSIVMVIPNIRGHLIDGGVIES